MAGFPKNGRIPDLPGPKPKSDTTLQNTESSSGDRGGNGHVGDSVSIGICRVCVQYVLVKLLEPRHDCSERLGVTGIKFYGFERKAAFVNSMLTSVTVANTNVFNSFVLFSWDFTVM